jgi:hypothetical protein
MVKLQNISHIYRGLIIRNRAFASFREDEIKIISDDIKKTIKKGECILDPMSGYGGTMLHFGKRGYKSVNIEMNPPEYYWQLLINPVNKSYFIKLIKSVLGSFNKLPQLKEDFSITDGYFSEIAITHIKKLYLFLKSQTDETNNSNELIISLILPFVARFASYIKSTTNITHFKEGGFCSYLGWKEDFIDYLECINELICNNEYLEKQHKNYLGNIFTIPISKIKYNYFVTSPPYPNYRDYAKIFSIENWVLKNIFNLESNFDQMIGSNNVSGKQFEKIDSIRANEFLLQLLKKSKSLSKKSKRDIETYYHPYFSLYFYHIQEAYNRLNKMLSNTVTGYIVANDNITRDIQVPVGAFICDVFKNLGYNTEFHNDSEINHYGNIGRSAKRMNAHHIRHIIKVWKA